MNHLRNATVRSQRPWQKEELRAGFAYFKQLYGRYPTSHEIDTFEYLPSARSMQRSFGGLVRVREELFPEEISNFAKGVHRSGVAKRTYAQGKDFEEAFYARLTTKFEEIAVHEHKVIRPGDVNCDFYIYLNKSQGIVIDIFYADSIINFINVVNIKLKRYSLIAPTTYLVVVGNEAITQELIDLKTANRRLPLPSHIKLSSEESFFAVHIPLLQKQSIYSIL